MQLFGTPAQRPVVKTTPAPTPVPPTQIAQATPAPAAETEAVLAERDDTPIQTEVTGIEEVPVIVATEPEVAPVAVDETPAQSAEDVIVIEKAMISTSSGLAVANIVETPQNNEAFAAGLATKPNVLLQIVYVLFGFVVVGLLLASVVIETRQAHYVKAAYGLGLLIVMGGLWYVHMLLTSGAVVV